MCPLLLTLAICYINFISNCAWSRARFCGIFWRSGRSLCLAISSWGCLRCLVALTTCPLCPARSGSHRTTARPLLPAVGPGQPGHGQLPGPDRDHRTAGQRHRTGQLPATGRRRRRLFTGELQTPRPRVGAISWLDLAYACPASVLQCAHLDVRQ